MQSFCVKMQLADYPRQAFLYVCSEYLRKKGKTSKEDPPETGTEIAFFDMKSEQGRKYEPDRFISVSYTHLTLPTMAVV